MEQRFRRIPIRVRRTLQFKMRNNVVMQLSAETSSGTVIRTALSVDLSWFRVRNCCESEDVR